MLVDRLDPVCRFRTSIRSGLAYSVHPYLDTIHSKPIIHAEPELEEGYHNVVRYVSGMNSEY